MLRNVKVTENDKTITLVIDKGTTLSKIGETLKSKNDDGSFKTRQNDLVATSGGWAAINAEFSISLNVNRAPKS